MNFVSHLLQIVALISLLYGIFLFITKPNRDFFKLIDNFNSKLPPKQKKAKEGIDNTYGFTTIDTTNMKLSIKTEEIDLFQRKLEIFKYYTKIIKNIRLGKVWYCNYSKHS